MSVKISRNEPCPCGSGKKYKKCCGLKETVSITAIIEQEVMNLQSQILEFALFEYEREINHSFQKKVDDLTTEDDQEMEFFMFIHSLWFTLFVPVYKEKTILQIFIEDRGKMIQRPKVKEILQSWTDPRPIAGRVLSITPETIIVQDTLTDETIQIKLLEPFDSYDNLFVFGMLVPFGQENVFFITPFDLEGGKDEKEEQFLRTMFLQSKYENPVKFLKNHLVELMNELPYSTVEYSPDDFEWTAPGHKEVATLYTQKMQELNAPNTNMTMGLILWFKFCEKIPVQRKKPATYAAALHYVNVSMNPLADVTKKGIAEMYGVSPSSLSGAVLEMEGELSHEITDLKSVVYDQLLDALEAFEMEKKDLDDKIEDDELPF